MTNNMMNGMGMFMGQNHPYVFSDANFKRERFENNSAVVNQQGEGRETGDTTAEGRQTEGEGTNSSKKHLI